MTFWEIAAVVVIITFIGETARWKDWAAAGRTRMFFVLLLTIAVWNPPHPWPLVFAVFAYLWLLYPMLDKGGPR